MRKIIAIAAGDPDSINSEIIAKAWKKKNLFKNLNIFIVGNYNLIKRQLRTLKISIKLGKVHNIEKENFKKQLLVYDVPLKFKSPFNTPIKYKSNHPRSLYSDYYEKERKGFELIFEVKNINQQYLIISQMHE